MASADDEDLLPVVQQRITFGMYKLRVRSNSCVAQGLARRLHRMDLAIAASPTCKPAVLAALACRGTTAIEAFSWPCFPAFALVHGIGFRCRGPAPRMRACPTRRQECLRLIHPLLTSTAPLLQRNVVWLPSMAGSLVAAAAQRKWPTGLLQRNGLYADHRPLSNPLIWFHTHSAGVCPLAHVMCAFCSALSRV